MINRVILVGNAGRDAEVKKLENGTSVAGFSLATSENYKDKSDEWQSITTWHNIVCWRHLAEKAGKDVKKGTQVYVEGKISAREYTDKDGVVKRVTDIVANQILTFDHKEKVSSLPQEEHSNIATEPNIDLPF